VPVIGHAFVGVATAVAFPASNARPPAPTRSEAAWLGAIVACAYLPDIVSQGLRFLVVGDPRQPAHSLALAALVSVPVAWALSSLTRSRFSRALGVVFASVLLHDLLDVLEWPGRMPFWPFSAWTADFGSVLPRGVRTETLLFGGIALAVVVTRARHLGATGGTPQAVLGVGRWLVLAFVAAIAVLPVALYTLRCRNVRERQALQATRYLHAGDPARALYTLDEAKRWPGVARPARLDHLRAEALSLLGREAEAEPLYLRAREGDPTSFWFLADLAQFYAASSRPAGERRRLVEPLLSQLAAGFSSHPRYAEVVERIERHLGPAGARP